MGDLSWAAYERWKARRDAADRVLAFIAAHDKNKPDETVLGCSFESAPLSVADLKTLAESV